MSEKKCDEVFQEDMISRRFVSRDGVGFRIGRMSFLGRQVALQPPALD